MPLRGSTERPVKAASPAPRGRSEAERLDGAEASQRIGRVMVGCDAAIAGSTTWLPVRVAAWRLSARGRRVANCGEARRRRRGPVASAGVGRDRGPRRSPRRDRRDTAPRSRPSSTRGTTGASPRVPRSDARHADGAPPATARRQAVAWRERRLRGIRRCRQTAGGTDARRHLQRDKPGAWRVDNGGRACAVPELRGNDEGLARMCSHGEDQDQWTVVKSRLAVRSRANRPSCHGVR